MKEEPKDRIGQRVPANTAEERLLDFNENIKRIGRIGRSALCNPKRPDRPLPDSDESDDKQGSS